MLCSADPLARQKRVVVAGLYHGAEWIPRPEFFADVDLFTREPTWVTEWQYRDARPLLSARADTLVVSWLTRLMGVAAGQAEGASIAPPKRRVRWA